MIKYFKNYYLNLDKNTIKILKNGWKFCSIICFIGIFLLLAYLIFLHSPFLYKIGISIFQLSIIFAIEFLVCGFVVDSIKKGN